jgi:glycosyltransferase involved in cell wall biosynthesis
MFNYEAMRVGYVVKRYPRYSETFIVNEILAHEEAGLEIEIFSLNFPYETHFQDIIARVRAPVNYLLTDSPKVSVFWETLNESSRLFHGFWNSLVEMRSEEAHDIYLALVLAREIYSKGITHLHAHFASKATTVARCAAKFSGLTYSFTAHAKDIFHESVIRDSLEQKLSDASAVVTVSDYNLEYLKKTYGVEANGVTRIYNGIDLEKFTYEAPYDRPPRVVAVGRLIEKKGFSDLVEASAILAKRGIRFDCQIIGTGPLEADLRAQIERLNLKETVKLMGPLPQDDVIKYIQSGSVVAAPCIIGSDGNRDGLPTVILEAMALGTPCVSTDITGIPEVLQNEETGLMVPQSDPLALAGEIEKLLSSPPLRVRLAAQARRLIEMEFDIKRNCETLRSVFLTCHQKNLKLNKLVL